MPSLGSETQGSGAAPAAQVLNAAVDDRLLSRIEDAGLNASAPPQQRWTDGWLLRLSPGKAKRARCINAVAAGRQPLSEQLARAEVTYREAGLPMLVRITPFSQPAELDQRLAALGYSKLDDTRVMVSPDFSPPDDVQLPLRCRVQPVGLQAFAQQVGEQRGTPLAQRQAHAQRLELSPVPFHAMVLIRDSKLIACGQFAIEGDLVGLYDIFTAPHARGRGFAQALCRLLLAEARLQGARHAYLQVESDNLPALAVYRKLGFTEGYAYHYRSPPGAPDHPATAA